MKSLFITLSGLLGLVGLGPAYSSEPGYELTAIDFPGVDYSNSGFVAANGINNRGEILGCEEINLEDHGYCFIFDDRTKPTYGTAPTIYTIALGINDDGVVVGAITDTADTSYFDKSFILAKGVFTIFSYPGSALTDARAINDKGLVTGNVFSPDGSSTNGGFLYDPVKGTFLDLPSGAIGTNLAQGINRRGEVVGNVFHFPDEVYPGSPIGMYGYYRSAKGQLTLFRVNGASTRARGINNDGLITGYFTLGGQDIGFVTRLGGDEGHQDPSIPRYVDVTIKDSELLSFPNSVGTEPEAISDAGVIVGNWLSTDGSVSHAFVARPVGCRDGREHSGGAR
jgi:uncharacterized membrane protein